eukprot:CAMPEP_0179274310 /NCGR_PEP_ID=MMETSP0797-20121207/33462_1 /TAXON_ID=47934 /ORGANISM="Dinophysis acuminata, Strain DAEP01" /LENGTH=637 /DNA_ID=CAMNT_0020982763 /DNA_START=200 /DNA_END=2110 /DNA_ORIENTATION=+
MPVELPVIAYVEVRARRGVPCLCDEACILEQRARLQLDRGVKHPVVRRQAKEVNDLVVHRLCLCEEIDEGRCLRSAEQVRAVVHVVALDDANRAQHPVARGGLLQEPPHVRDAAHARQHQGVEASLHQRLHRLPRPLVRPHHEVRQALEAGYRVEDRGRHRLRDRHGQERRQGERQDHRRDGQELEDHDDDGVGPAHGGREGAGADDGEGRGVLGVGDAPGPQELRVGAAGDSPEDERGGDAAAGERQPDGGGGGRELRREEEEEPGQGAGPHHRAGERGHAEEPLEDHRRAHAEERLERRQQHDGGADGRQQRQVDGEHGAAGAELLVAARHEVLEVHEGAAEEAAEARQRQGQHEEPHQVVRGPVLLPVDVRGEEGRVALLGEAHLEQRGAEAADRRREEEALGAHVHRVRQHQLEPQERPADGGRERGTGAHADHGHEEREARVLVVDEAAEGAEVPELRDGAGGDVHEGPLRPQREARRHRQGEARGLRGAHPPPAEDVVEGEAAEHRPDLGEAGARRGGHELHEEPGQEQQAARPQGGPGEARPHEGRPEGPEAGDRGVHGEGDGRRDGRGDQDQGQHHEGLVADGLLRLVGAIDDVLLGVLVQLGIVLLDTSASIRGQQVRRQHLDAHPNS